jgi:hypothetical protein
LLQNWGKFSTKPIQRQNRNEMMAPIQRREFDLFWAAKYNARTFIAVVGVYLLRTNFIGGVMARPIKETPVLTGKHAQRFEKAVKANESKKVTRQEYERAVIAFKSITKK